MEGRNWGLQSHLTSGYRRMRSSLATAAVIRNLAEFITNFTLMVMRKDWMITWWILHFGKNEIILH